MDKLVNRIGNPYPALVQSHTVIAVDIQGHVRKADIPERPLPIERPLSLARRAGRQLGSPQHPSVNPRKFSVTIGLKREKRLALNAMRAFGFTSAANPIPLPKAKPRAMGEHSGRCTWAKLDASRFGITFGRHSKTIEAYESITS